MLMGWIEVGFQDDGTFLWRVKEIATEHNEAQIIDSNHQLTIATKINFLR